MGERSGGERGATPGDAAVDAVSQPLGRLLRLGASRNVHARQAAAAGVRISQPGAVLLARLVEDGPLALGDLAGRVDMDTGVTSRQVKALEGEGLVERRARPADARVSEVAATAAGRRVRRAIAAVQHRHMADVLAEWSAEDRARFAADLDRFVADLRAVHYRPADQDRRSA